MYTCVYKIYIYIYIYIERERDREREMYVCILLSDTRCRCKAKQQNATPGDALAHIMPHHALPCHTKPTIPCNAHSIYTIL